MFLQIIEMVYFPESQPVYAEKKNASPTAV